MYRLRLRLIAASSVMLLRGDNFQRKRCAYGSIKYLCPPSKIHVCKPKYSDLSNTMSDSVREGRVS